MGVGFLSGGNKYILKESQELAQLRLNDEDYLKSTQLSYAEILVLLFSYLNEYRDVVRGTRFYRVGPVSSRRDIVHMPSKCNVTKSNFL